MNQANGERKLANIFERYMTAWVALRIVGGILLGKAAPAAAKYLDGLSITAKGAPVVCHGHGAVRLVLRRGIGHGGRRSDRSAGDALAGTDLPADTPLVWANADVT
jgi:hypothetical protein